MKNRRIKLTLATLALALLATVGLTVVGCTSILGDFEVTNDAANTDGGGNGETGTGTKVNGDVCAAPTDCASGTCADGVCCESVCSGTCESCNLAGLAGKCMPIPDGEDPANECPTTPLPDAGIEDAGVVFEDASDASDDAAAPVSDAATFDLPEAGVATEQNQCAGKCNGKRACWFPDVTRTCGGTVCGNKTQQGRAACDGQGHCLFGIEPCEAYACPDGKAGCVKTCTGESDCLATHFCDAATSSCKPKLGSGSACTSAATCQSGYCVDNVCCNDACNGFPGATCTKPGSVGTCSCTACANGKPCQLFFRDEDGDTFGDKHGTIANGRATPGCVNPADGPPPAGFVGNKLDCFDGPGAVPPTVRPNQTGWFGTTYPKPTVGPSYDYDCDDQEEKLVPEFPGASCKFCRKITFPITACTTTTTSCTNNESAGLACKQSICIKGQICSTGCTTNTVTGFTLSVPCGDTKAATNCGYCSSNAITGTTFPQTQQQCH